MFFLFRKQLEIVYPREDYISFPENFIDYYRKKKNRDGEQEQ